MMPTDAALDPAEADHDVGGVERLHLEEVAGVDDVLDDLVHVVRLVGRVGDQRVELAVRIRDLELDVALVDRQLGQVVVRQEADERARVVERVVLVARQVVRDAADLVVGERAAELLEADVLTRDGLDDVGSGHEHVAGLVDHDHEVGERGGVDGAARGRAHDDRDLRDDAGCRGVEAEDLAVLAEGDHALLDPGAARVEHADDGDAGLEGELHDLDDLLAGDLAERAAEDREVLGVDRDLAAVDRAGSGHHRVAVGAVVLHAEGVGAVSHELVELDEGALVEQQLDALARRLLALGMLLLDRRLAARRHGRVVADLEVGEFSRGRGEFFGAGGGRRRGVGCHAVQPIDHSPGEPVGGCRQKPRSGLGSAGLDCPSARASAAPPTP